MNSRNILVGVCGGVAAYKALDVVSALRKQGHAVRVVMTDSATRFVQPASFAAVSGRPVLTTLWPASPATLEEEYPHLYPATETELFLLIPATANTLAKIAGGFGSDLLSTNCLSLPADCERVFCPAMNVEMWRNPVVQQNTRTLEARGWRRLGPTRGHLACGMTGEGRLMEPADILKHLEPLLTPHRPLEGRTVLILSGPTREHLDPVRYLGNASSGRMGRALALEAAARGARVHFVTGPVADEYRPVHPRVAVDPVTSALEMLDHARAQLPDADAVLYAAAVADYRPRNPSPDKPAKSAEPAPLELIPNPDLAATLNGEKRPEVFTIGFALQTDSGEDAARRKLDAKSFDGIVLNHADSMNSPAGHFRYLAKGSDAFQVWGALEKTEVARRILDQLPQTL